VWRFVLKLAVLLIVFCVACSQPNRSSSSDVGQPQYPEPDVIIDAGSNDDVMTPTPDVTDVPDEASEDTKVSTDTPPPPPKDTGAPDKLPPPNGVAKFSNCSEPGGDRNIYDLQDPQCPDHIKPAPKDTPGVPVILKDVVVTAAYGDTIFVQEKNGGPYSGIAVFTHGLPTAEFKRGHVLDVTGNFFEYFEQSQVYLEKWTKTGESDPPIPFKVSHPAHIATDGEMAEMMEGVLVQVSDVETTHTKPDCPQDWGEFYVTGDLRVDDMGAQWDARLGDQFASVTGPMLFTFGNSKIAPRDEADLDVTKKGGKGSTSKCIELDCIIPKSEMGTKAVVINEIMADPLDNDESQEWIEVYNPSNKDVSMDGWVLKDCGGQKVPLVGANLVVPAKGYFVLGNSANKTINGDVPVDHAYGDQFYLPNTVGSVILYDGSNAFAKVVDQARYSKFEPFKALQTGRSMERVSPSSDGTDPDSWKTGTKDFGNAENKGTPGKKNSAKP